MIITNKNTISIVIVLFCVGALWIIPLQIEDGETAFATGATMLPDLAVSLILLFTLTDLLHSLVKAIRSTAGREEALANDVPLKGPQFLGLTLVAGAMSIYAFVLPEWGYLVSSMLLLAFLMKCTGARSLTKLVAVTAVVVLGLYLCMKYGFGVHVKALPNLAGLGG